MTNVLQVTYSVNGDGGYVADVSYTGEAQVILFFCFIFVFQKLNWRGIDEVSSEQSIEYTNIHFFSLIELFLYSPLDIVTVITTFLSHLSAFTNPPVPPSYILSPFISFYLSPSTPLAIFYPTYLILFIPQYPPEPAGGYGRK